MYIPMGEGAELCKTLLAGEGTKAIYRKAGRYSVSVYDRHYQALLDAGDIQPIDEESAVLVNPALYDKNRGLSLRADVGRAEFI